MGAGFLHLRKRAHFLQARQGVRAAQGHVALEASHRGDDTACRIGFTATRKLGNAVMRNRAKRRMREMARAILVPRALNGVDYVLIARGGICTANWPRLLDDLSAALVKLHAALSAQAAKSGRAKSDHASP
jgi:ribonuclease P protein component